MICLELTIPALPHLVMAGHTVWPADARHFERRFDVYDVVFVKRGKLYMTEDDTPYEVCAGEMLVLEPKRLHYGHQHSGEETEMYWLHFVHNGQVRTVESGDISWSAMLQAGTSRDETPPAHAMIIPKHTRIELSRLEPLLARLVELQPMLTLEHALEVHRLAFELFSLLHQAASRQFAPQLRAISEKTIAYLNDTLQEPFSSKRLESELHFDYDYISRCFKKYTGMTPARYIRLLRVEKAKTLLRGTELTLTEIGERVGVSDVNYFVRMFKETTGVTPMRYRLAGKGYV